MCHEFAIQTKGDFEMTIEKWQTDIFNQSIFITDLNIKSVKDKSPEKAKYYLSSAKINFIDFNIFSFIFSRALSFEKLELIGPKVTIFRNKIDSETDKPTQQKGKFSIYKLLKPYINALSIDNIEINNAAIKIYVDDKDSFLILNNSKNKQKITGLHIDKETDQNGRLFLAKKTEISIHDILFTTPDKLYTIKVGRLLTSYTDSSVIMDSVKLIPNYSKLKFGKAAGEQTDRISIAVDNIKFSRIDVKLFFEKNWFVARQLKVSELVLDVYRDKNDIRRPKTLPSIQELISKIPIYIKIDTVLLSHAICIYQEVAIDAQEPGKIFFNNLDATITGFKNRDDSIHPKNDLVIKVNCLLMGQGKLNLEYRFPYHTKGTNFTCEGHLQAMSFLEINKVFQPITNMQITSGELDYMLFSFQASEYASEGKMKLVYKGLQVQLLKDRNLKHNPAKKLLSFLANTLIIIDENPKKNHPIRVTRIHYRRNPERFIFNYTLKSLLSGIKTAIGLPDLQSDRSKK